MSVSMSEYNFSVGTEGNMYEAVIGIKRIGLGYSKEVEGNIVSGQIFIRTIPTVFAVVAVSSLIGSVARLAFA